MLKEFSSKYQRTYLGNGEKSDPGHDQQGHCVEPTANVGQDPKRKTELDRVQHVLDHEQTPELFDGAVQLIGGFVGIFVDLVGRNRAIHTCLEM